MKRFMILILGVCFLAGGAALASASPKGKMKEDKAEMRSQWKENEQRHESSAVARGDAASVTGELFGSGEQGTGNAAAGVGVERLRHPERACLPRYRRFGRGPRDRPLRGLR